MKKVDLWFWTLVIFGVSAIFLMVLCSGCQESQKKVWGKGELAAGWIEFFGDDNTARLDWLQTKTINEQGQRIADLNEKIRMLEIMVYVEEPNSITLESRVKKLEESPIWQEFFEVKNSPCELTLEVCPKCEDATDLLRLMTTPECPKGFDVIIKDLYCNKHIPLKAN